MVNIKIRFSRKYSGLRNICITQRFKKLVTVVNCRNHCYRKQSGRSGIRFLLQRSPWCSMGHLTFFCELISMGPDRSRAHSARSSSWGSFFFVLAINQRTTRLRGLDLIKSLGQLSSIERGDNVILFRDILRCYLVRLHFKKVRWGSIRAINHV